MSGVNKVILLGRLGQDPELKSTNSGFAVCNFSIATSKSWKDKDSGEKQEKTEWHNIVCFRKTAENIGKYFKKGSLIYLEGELETQSWEKDGVKKYKTIINAHNFQFVEKRQDSERGDPPAGSDPQFATDDEIPF